MHGLKGRMTYHPRFGPIFRAVRGPIIVIMGKKNDTSTPVTPGAPAPASIVAKPEAATPSPPTAETAPAKAPVKKKAATPVKKAVKKKPAAKKPAAKKATAKFSTDDIALRAYFLSEHRHHHGLHGDAHTDWVEAERQLKAEARKAAKKK
jgi:hypothetical protein